MKKKNTGAATSRVGKHLPNIRKLQRMSKKERKKFLSACCPEFVDTLSECCKNVLKGNVPLKAFQLKKLRRYKKVLRKVASSKASNADRRQLLVQKGGFLGLLLKPLLGIATSLFGGLLGGQQQ
jgi:hypothetical protein